jgi:MFS family permease
MNTNAPQSAAKPLAVRNFRLLWLGETVSLLGDQFYLVGLPWLTLRLGGDGLALGTVLMTAAVPRALLMLLGGAVSDRLSPRNVMLASNLLRGLAVALLTALVAGGALQLAHVYVLAVLFGTVDAFYHPSLLALVPSLVARERLESANALVQGSEQLAMLLGPALAGLVIAATGLSTAFGIDALTFLFTVSTLLAMRVPARTHDEEAPNMLRQIGTGLRYAFQAPALRVMLVAVALLNLAIAGPAGVGLPLLAHQRFGGAAVFGLMMSVFGGSTLVGALLAGSAFRRVPLGKLMAGAPLLFAGALGVVGVAQQVPPLLAALAVMGLGAGALNVRAVAWLQGRTDPAFRGRVMSLVMFASVGLAPLSLAGAGLLVGYGFAPLFAGAAGLMVLVTLVVVLSGGLGGLEPAPGAA